jgi:hypothetical protein
MKGRPKQTEPTPLLIYKQEFINKDGVKSTWFWDKTRFANGPYKVSISYPDGWISDEDARHKRNKKLPKHKQKYLNPKTGKEISYQRYIQLGYKI